MAPMDTNAEAVRKSPRILDAGALPLALRSIPDPPQRLYCRGDAARLAEPAVAVVGSRRCTRQGRDLAFALARDLAAHGLNVVSGLAFGIDAAAHRGALSAGGGCGTTIAVLGGGLGSIYPRSHEPLAAEIVAAGGVLATEYAPREPARKHHFPARNRIVSGLCLGVVVVEASTKSGSLITARMALEQGRDVMAMPSLVASPLSAGCHRLIREGAALVECAEHVFEALCLEWRELSSPTPETAAEDDAVLAQVRGTVTSVDAIAHATGLPMPTLLRRLAELELEGLVAAQQGGYVRSALAGRDG